MSNWNVNVKSQSVSDAKAAVAALDATPAVKAAAVADIDNLVAANSPSVLVTLTGNGTNTDEPPVKVRVTKG